MSEAVTRYKFKWSNYDLSLYVKSRRSVAAELRNEAAILMARAQQIADETDELEQSLVEIGAVTP